LFALGRDLNKRACQQRSDTRSGILDAKRDKTMDWIMMRDECREGPKCGSYDLVAISGPRYG